MSICKYSSYDIVIAGSGASGCAAAVQAGQEGLSVLLVEKADAVGGCGVFTEGLLGLQTAEAKAQGIDITPEEVFKEEAEFSKYKANLPILRNLINASNDTVEWLRNLGVSFDPITAMGHGKPVMQPYKGGGWAVINDALIPNAKKLGAEILTSTALVELHADEAATSRALRFETKAPAKPNSSPPAQSLWEPGDTLTTKKCSVNTRTTT
ncbi:FAD-dependent oxidoreductase [Agrobacterium salinitolerans]|uniref:FAD-dependent oxidoreductase n=1 Tax=Agrobacterium salinitolerans TaxID=1183413 RepID=UPI001056DFC0|nr:FAD-binding protein [Agrobacterium salinitolerans]